MPILFWAISASFDSSERYELGKHTPASRNFWNRSLLRENSDLQQTGTRRVRSLLLPRMKKGGKQKWKNLTAIEDHVVLRFAMFVCSVSLFLCLFSFSVAYLKGFIAQSVIRNSNFKKQYERSVRVPWICNSS